MKRHLAVKALMACCLPAADARAIGVGVDLALARS